MFFGFYMENHKIKAVERWYCMKFYKCLLGSLSEPIPKYQEQTFWNPSSTLHHNLVCGWLRTFSYWLTIIELIFQASVLLSVMRNQTMDIFRSCQRNVWIPSQPTQILKYRSEPHIFSTVDNSTKPTIHFHLPVSVQLPAAVIDLSFPLPFSIRYTNTSAQVVAVQVAKPEKNAPRNMPIRYSFQPRLFAAINL